MEVIFNKCKDAINHSLATNAYGIFYSDKGVTESLIHVHDCCEVMLCLRGGDTFLIDDNIYDVGEGDIFIINQFEPHKITFKENESFERYVFQIHPAFIYGNSTDQTDLSICFYTREGSKNNRIRLNPKELSYMLTLVKRLKETYDFGDDIIKNITLAEILTLINTKFMEGAQLKEKSLSKSNKIIREAIGYINLHYSEDIKLSDIAANSYVSVNHLCNLFKKCLGTSVIKYLISKRISEAKKLLKSGKSISETAALCGFGDYANFIRTFKNMVGVSPGKYN